MKKCTLCKKLKLVDAFNKKASTKDGLQGKCRECSKAESKAYYKLNAVKHKAHVKKRRKEWAAFMQREVDNLKSTTGCIRCGENDSCCLDYHHIDPSTKVDQVSNLIRNKRCREVILAEIAKCECLCANCHRKFHAGRFA